MTHRLIEPKEIKGATKAAAQTKTRIEVPLQTGQEACDNYMEAIRYNPEKELANVDKSETLSMVHYFVKEVQLKNWRFFDLHHI